ncbi:MAG: hypothetical protein QOG62_707 [Thermoleophilaceae bacterium]|jgi:hypothetical protein|nr:hypothetical protein [Thermoleophilaceae bacterium]
MSRSFKLIAAVMAVCVISLIPVGVAGAKNGGNPTYFAKLTGDGRGVAIVELRGKKKVCVTLSMRKYSPNEAQIKAHGKKGKIKVDTNGKRECDKEKKLSERLTDGEGKGKTRIEVKGDQNNDKSHGKLRSAVAGNDKG